MPAESGAQQKAAGAALSAKRGDTPKGKLKGASKSMADSMSEKSLRKWPRPNARANPSTSRRRIEHRPSVPNFPAKGTAMLDIELARVLMVERRLRGRGVYNDRLLDAMREVPRDFISASLAVQAPTRARHSCSRS